MKFKIKTLFLLLSINLIVGCGGSAGGETSGNEGGTISVPMKIGVAMKIDAGYKILSNDPDAVVDIIILEDNKTAVLVSGEASIEKPI